MPVTLPKASQCCFESFNQHLRASTHVPATTINLRQSNHSIAQRCATPQLTAYKLFAQVRYLRGNIRYHAAPCSITSDSSCLQLLHATGRPLLATQLARRPLQKQTCSPLCNSGILQGMPNTSHADSNLDSRYLQLLAGAPGSPTLVNNPHRQAAVTTTSLNDAASRLAASGQRD
jgi:hypothetical protein